MSIPDDEHHFIQRAGWLRAAVLGANDGLLSVASLLMGVAAATGENSTILLTGVAGLVAGALSMAAGEFVSVSSQADIEKVDLDIERRALEETPEEELQELAQIYVQRGVEPALAHKVAAQLMAHDALGAHARDELGLIAHAEARPTQAAFASALSFAVGACVPIIASISAPVDSRLASIAIASIAGLIALGGVSARTGGAPVAPAIMRVTLWGLFAMGATALIGSMIGDVLLSDPRHR
ncbi:MAG: VIT family protein [Pseudomonadota bacterium]